MLGLGQITSDGGSDTGQGLGRGRGTELVSKGAPAPWAPGDCQVCAAGGAGGSGLSAGALVRCCEAGRRCPQACPFGRRTAQRCANLQFLSLHSVRLNRKQSVLLPCLSCRFFMVSVSAATCLSSLRRVCTFPPFLPLPLPPLLPLPGPLGMRGRARGWSSAWMSALTLVISRSASSRVHPSLWRLDISFHSLRSALSNSCVLTVRRPESDARLCVHMVQDLFVECFEDG